jgi:arylsulfatase A-like enzyme
VRRCGDEWTRRPLANPSAWRLLAEVEKSRLMENTIGVFAADHGNLLGERGRWFEAQSPPELAYGSKPAALT